MAGQPSSYSGKPPQQTRTTPSQYDYATLYEEWLLQAQQQQQNANDNNNNSYVSAMAMRAGRLGAMQCAIMDSATEKTDFLSGLLKRMELDEDLVVVDKNKKNNSHNQRMLPLPLATLEQNTSCKKKNNERNLASVADVDAFFEAYPECIRPGWEEYDDTSSSSSEEEELRPSRRKKRPLEKEKTPPAKLPEVAAPPHANYQSHSFSHLQQKPFGMESKHSNNYPQQQQQQQQPQPIYNATQTWEETHPQQEISAFQTAKEFAQSNGDYVPPPHRQQHQQRTSTNSVNEYHQYNPYQQQQPQEHEPPSNSPLVKPQGPLIRDSLKRKFQPPKRGAAAASNNSRGGEVRLPMIIHL